MEEDVGASGLEGQAAQPLAEGVGRGTFEAGGGWEAFGQGVGGGRRARPEEEGKAEKGASGHVSTLASSSAGRDCPG